MTADEYLARAAVSRVLYIELFRQACSVLPPTVDGEQSIECGYTIRDLAAVVGHTPSQVTMDMRRLENWGWVEKRKGSWRFLGRRVNGVFHLLADVAAMSATTESCLISRKLLGITIAETTPENNGPVSPLGASRGQGWEEYTS